VEEGEEGMGERKSGKREKMKDRERKRVGDGEEMYMSGRGIVKVEEELWERIKVKEEM